ncbi:hypothetical protein L1N85_16890 [Paenibacillus alkaliterrae]|uniref:hypothetical protein n=1 Tax=Paenibacillus alkaliterrae TaxID=320909 RepID=UPI001F44ABA9|nr:hypothetical protein [Paenibacillus alkaliterrae]MCF2940084.1 hypothetical protein [Paenibacillus alkaliterrae]
MTEQRIPLSAIDTFQIYAKHALRYRAVDYLLIPVDPKELNAALQKCNNELEAAAQPDRPALEKVQICPIKESNIVQFAALMIKL